jgi:hypothetical protein
MGGKMKTLFITVHIVTGDPEKGKIVLPKPNPGLRGSSQYGLQAASTLGSRTLKCTSGASNKNAIPPCGWIFSPVLRFIAPATTILVPARKNKKMTLNRRLCGGLKEVSYRPAQRNPAY